ncbi:MAG: hypothetical protein KC466_01370, partial [Myxococcales bacterium]|nr:hypothetical protein [Myxococcales bacterium]
LVAAASELNRRADADADQDRLAAIDAEARGVLARLLHEVRSAPERALHDLIRHTDPDTPPSRPIQVRRLVLMRVVQEGLAWRHEHRAEAAIQSALDTLVAACLDALPTSAPLVTELGDQTLVDRPYVGVYHESAILGLFELAADDPHLGTTASALLVTLWRNMERDGARTAAETASLALLFAEDASPSRRAAALEHLLRSSGSRYLAAALEAVQRAGDRDLVDRFASVAAEVLEPETALPVLRTLAESRRSACLAAHLQLVQRDPAAVREAYENHLADGTAPAFRLGLVRSAGWSRGEDAVELARMALESDPDPQVRRDALLALASAATVEQLGPSMEAVLSDPQRANDPAWIDAVAGALVNARGSGSLELLARYGPRVVSDSVLGPAFRDQLVAALEARIPEWGSGEQR